MKGHIVSTLYLCTSMLGLYWTSYYTMLGIWGLAFSVWHIVVFSGAILLGAGAFMQWTLPRRWTLGLLIIGSCAMAAYWMVPFLHDLPGYIGVCIVVAFFGAILLSASKILQWALPRRWTRLLPIAGSCVMASFFCYRHVGQPVPLHRCFRLVTIFTYHCRIDHGRFRRYFSDRGIESQCDFTQEKTDCTAIVIT